MAQRDTLPVDLITTCYMRACCVYVVILLTDLLPLFITVVIAENLDAHKVSYARL